MALSIDVAVALVLAFGSAAIVSVFDTGIAVLEVLSGLALFLFLPGYLVVSALFPAKTVREDSNTEPTRIGGVERFALSVVGSLSIAMLVGFVLNFTPWGIRFGPIVLALCGLSLAAAVIAVYRRWRVPERNRVSTAALAPVGTNDGRLGSRRDFLVHGFGAVALLFAGGTIVYAIADRPRGESYTEFYILGRDDGDDPGAADYPRSFEAGGGRPITVGIENSEREATEYVVAAAAQRVSEDGDELEVREQELLDRFETRLDAGESIRERIELAPTLTGDRIRLAFFLYRGDAPDDPSAETAYRDLHVWVSVDEDA